MPIADGKTLAAAQPTRPGVYRFWGAGERVLYVGKAKDLKKRVCSYFYKKQQSPRIALMLREAEAMDSIVTASEAEALLLENNLIKTQKPRYNILFRDDKSYPYLCLTRHPYPRLRYYRGAVKDDADYFGPFPDSAAVKETVDILQRVFRLRNCSDSALMNRSRPCLLHAIGRCSAPCTNAVAPAAYAADAAQARRFLRGGVIAAEGEMQERMREAAAAQRFEEAAALRDRLRALAVVRSRHFAEAGDGGGAVEADYVGIFHSGVAACVNIVMVRGGRRVGEKRLFPDNADGGDAMQVGEALLSQYYREIPARPLPAKIFMSPAPEPGGEAAAHLGDRLVVKPAAEEARRAAAAAENARLALINRGNAGEARRQRLAQLGQRLRLAGPPRRIECFDVSHSMGEETVASRVVFEEGAPCKRAYRLFRMRGVMRGGDDYAAMGEAVERCYRRVAAEGGAAPDLLLIDGGVGQVSAALAAFERLGMVPPPLFGVAKGAARRPGEETLIGADGEALRLPRVDAALHLIQAVRDEAHRFAVAAHRRRRDRKRGTLSVLDGIEGVGVEKRRLLMSYFGGFAALRAASAVELQKVSGIGAELAVRIYKRLH